MKRLSLIPILFITASLAACSGTSPEEKQSAAVNDVGSAAETSKNKPSPSAPRNDSKGSASPEPAQPEASNKNQQSTPPQSKRMRSGSQKDQLDKILMRNYNPGDQVTINGGPATLCVRGDGYGTHMLAAGPNTSCEFAKAVMSKQTSHLNATTDNIRDSLRPSILVKSPVTNETYTLHVAPRTSRDAW